MIKLTDEEHSNFHKFLFYINVPNNDISVSLEQIELYKNSNLEEFNILSSKVSKICQNNTEFNQQQSERKNFEPILFKIKKCPKCNGTDIVNLGIFNWKYTIECLNVLLNNNTKVRMCPSCKIRW